ncbi:unnamed protein product [Amaranthus hypochondriacus]
MANLVPTFSLSFTCIKINNHRLFTHSRSSQSYSTGIGTGHFPAVRAAPNSPGPTSQNSTHNSPFQDDLKYVAKLGVGSVLGAALIKYGSAIVPNITTPNITLALFMILAPVLIAVVLLFNGSTKN